MSEKWIVQVLDVWRNPEDDDWEPVFSVVAHSQEAAEIIANLLEDEIETLPDDHEDVRSAWCVRYSQLDEISQDITREENAQSLIDLGEIFRRALKEETE